MKLWWHKLTHWEYWSEKVVYLPSFLLWGFFAIKFRSLSFFKYANPSIKNGGLYADAKIDIYKLLPDNLYPKTVLIEVNRRNDFVKIITDNKFSFPLIVKPNIGLRGIGVQKVHSLNELIAYSANSYKDFLIQELIEYSNEIGLFYCRYPNQKNGTITGLTLKKFLEVEGNGNETIEELLQLNPRFKLQIPKLKKKMELSEILPLSEKRCLVPFGNHNRGTEFLDGKEYITSKLEQVFDSVLKNVNGFYYGRLDIRYNSFEELEQGKNFCIIELNGAKSEPTHIYDPKHSFWKGQKEIFRHQMIFQQIVRQNMKLIKKID